MKKSGFTLVELLATVVLLAGIMLLVFPNVVEKVQQKEPEIEENRKKILYNAAYDFFYENKASYPLRVGKVYCVSVGYLSSINQISADEYEDLLIDKTKTNYIKVEIGTSDNLYSIVTNLSSCTDGVVNLEG